jgi:hypothetical protein
MTPNAAQRFTVHKPSQASYWRAVILFGRNVASYKFALGKALLDLAQEQREEVTLDELAAPYSDAICEHLKVSDKQGTSKSSRFLDACRGFNAGSLTRDQLIGATSQLGFNNVIDAFHVVDKDELPIRFFTDERSSTTKGIRLTSELLELATGNAASDFEIETEARWRLVETAWEMNLPTRLLTVELDPDLDQLVPRRGSGRTPITSARGALNGYQKGFCFYCFRPLTLDTGNPDIANVDHFLPHSLGTRGWNQSINLDGVWNLVLACPECNGTAEKGARLPAKEYLERLHIRNEFLIGSHHPLRETLIAQTGGSEKERVLFLQTQWVEAQELGLSASVWKAEPLGASPF